MSDSRPKRSCAGENIGGLINKELKGDDFYSTAYGGFGDDSTDDEYESECSEEDEVDSDFDMDESGWGPDDDAEDALQKEMKQRKRKVWISGASTSSEIAAKSKTKKFPRVAATTMCVSSLTSSGDKGSRTFRKSTQETSLGFKRRFEAEEKMKRKRRKTTHCEKDRRMTQTELLEEAKLTEVENLASLEAYTRMVEERKKVKLKKKPWVGPMVRYLSLTMPVVTEAESCGGCAAGCVNCAGNLGNNGVCDPSISNWRNGREEAKEIQLQEKDEKMRMQLSGVSSLNVPIPMDTGTGEDGIIGDKCADSVLVAMPTGPQSDRHVQQALIQRQSRNFMIFMDTNNFPLEYFPIVRPMKPKRRLCPVTRLPAKYIDPLTRTPYATPFAFKVIRTKYVNEAEQKCERRLMQLSSWLEEKKKKKKMEST